LEPIIAAVNLTKRFRRVLAVDGLDLAVERGEVFGFLGPNGAGKSTTLRMMVGLIRPTRGTVRLFGHDVWREHCAALRNVGAMIEAPAFYKYLSGRDNLRILYNTGGDCTPKQIDETLDIVGLLSRAGDKVKSYSQGMRQRLGIALAVLGKPDLVLMDEPTNGLDPLGMKEVRDLIARLSSEMNLTVFLSSHLLHEVEQVCTRIAVVNKGRVIESGKVSDLLRQSESYDVHAHPADAASEAIARIEWASVEATLDGMLNVTLTGGSAAELNKALVEQGVAVSALIPRKPSLEELYLRLMQEQ
jgi:ABC-2 type transport system ATP-binding protein